MPVDLQNLMNDAVWHHQAGRFADAERIYRQVLGMAPDSGAALNNLGDALCALGRPEEAEACFRHALMLSPDDAEAHNNLGALLFELGRPDAEDSFHAALRLNPDHVQAHANLGAALHARHRLADAEKSYRRALALDPGMMFAALNLAAALWEQSKLDEAAQHYRRVLQHYPQESQALNGLAAVTLAMGEPAAALDWIRQSLAIQDSAKARRIFCDIVRHLRWTADDPQIRELLARAIREAWARPRDLAVSAAGLIKHRHAGVMARGLQPGDAARLSQDKLLLALLVSTQNTDIELERFLTPARRLMLELDSEDGLEFWSALARQCFINEYVFFRDAEETAAAEQRREDLSAALEAGQSVTPMMVLTVAAYFPLASVRFREKLPDMKWPPLVDAVITQQVREPAEERRLRADIPQLTPIEDNVSRSVRAHYEENPYPRWIRPAPAERKTSIAQYLDQSFPLADFSAPAGRAQWLSAGCGTGQLAVESALGMDADILAVDLSLASLAYARRKAEELGVSNIRFAQADILTLNRSGQTFDVIESSGVLHHMAEPFAGWRALLELLNPGGVMLVALYSRLARRNVERTRQFITAQGYGVSAEAIRQCRQDLLAGGQADFVTGSSSDFFGISTCRDLLFHGQETQLDLGQIGAFLAENGLSLLGFEIGHEVLYAYRRRFAGDPAAVNLEHWQAFEADHPDTFAAMYNFWVRKPG